RDPPPRGWARSVPERRGRFVPRSATDGQEPGPGGGGAPDCAPQVRRPRMDLGIDLGTANTVVSDVRRGIVFDEPSVMLVGPGRARRPQLQAVGRDAADLLGRAPSRFTPLRPLHDG